MDCQKTRSFAIRRFAAGLLLLSSLTSPVLGQDSDLSLETLLERIERLEADNKRLQQRVAPIESEEAETADPNAPESDVEQASFSGSTSKHPKGWMYESTTPETLFAGGTATPLLNETYVRHIVAEEIIQRDQQITTSMSGSDQSADALQDQRIASLDNAFKSFQEKANKKTYPSVTVNGVFQSDAGWIHQDSNSEAQYGQIQDGADFRRARLSAKGSVTELTNYFFQMDFGFFGRPTFTDVWVEQTKVPFFGNVRIGQWKQPFGLETVSSFRYTTFMERSVLFQPFTPFRHIGIGFYDHSDDLSNTWAASVFRSGQDQFGGTLSSDGGYGTAERLTWVPSWDCDGKNYLHLGVGHFFNAPPETRSTSEQSPNSSSEPTDLALSVAAARQSQAEPMERRSLSRPVHWPMCLTIMFWEVSSYGLKDHSASNPKPWLIS